MTDEAQVQIEAGRAARRVGVIARALAAYQAGVDLLRGYALLMEQCNDIEAARAMWQEARTLYAAVSVQAGVDEAERRLAGLAG